MKSVLMSIKPRWCELIESGAKTVEIRKNKPKLDTPFKVYIYCSQGEMKYIGSIRNETYQKRMKVIGEFVCDKVEEIGFSPRNHGEYICQDDSFVAQSCVPFEEMFEYLGDGYGYGWHISDLVVYDNPKPLSDFWAVGKCPYATIEGCTYKYYCFNAGKTKRCGDTIERPPQSWCYVDGGADNEQTQT